MGKLLAIGLGVTIGAIALYFIFWLVFLKGVPKILDNLRLYTRKRREYRQELADIKSLERKLKIDPLPPKRKPPVRGR